MPSPILDRTNAQPLSLALLQEHVPMVKRGHRAVQQLRTPEAVELSRDEKRVLLVDRNKGTRSQETLIISALPLIKSIATREFQRRRAWNSRVSYDDILSEAIAGFIRGLLSYNEEAKNVSPTNYLGQWITASMRRKIEVMDHDFAVPYEVIERARRIRAVTSRLASETGRDPSDEEILAALNSGEQFNTGYKWGRVNVEGVAVPKSGQKQFTQRQLDEARDLASRSYALQSQDASPGGDDDQESYERASTPLTISEDTSHENIGQRDLARSQNSFFEQAFITMRIGSRQKEIIARFYGLLPYSTGQNQKEIITETGYPARFVKEVIIAFASYMPQPGGVFHKLLLDTPADTIEELELSWLLPQVGDWPESRKDPIKTPDILSQAGTRVR